VIVDVEDRRLGSAAGRVVLHCTHAHVCHLVLLQLQTQDLHLCSSPYLVESVSLVLLVELLADFVGVLKK